MLYAFLGWNRCGTDIERFENCKKTGIPYNKDPTECYNEAKTLQQCYGQQAMKVEPLCLPIFNDAKECLFQGDSHIWNCKEEINEFVFCNQKPQEYIEFLKQSTPQQRLPKRYDFVNNEAKYDWN